MKKKVLWAIVIIAALAIDHYSFHYISGTYAKTSTADTVKTTIVVDTTKKVVADTTKKAVATSSVVIAK